MLQKIPSLNKLVHELSRLPGVGEKTSLRLSYHLLRQSKQQINSLRDALREVRDNVKTCPNCFCYTETDLCFYCQSSQRSDQIICVVENPLDIEKIEVSKNFNGRYHVLHGVISPLDGISIKDLTIEELFKRIEKNNASGTPVQEVILALSANFESDTTVLYLAQSMKKTNIKVSRIAHGIPMGGDIDYIDSRTLKRAIENRVSI